MNHIEKGRKRINLWILFGFVMTVVFLIVSHLPALYSSYFSVDDESLIAIPQLAKPITLKTFQSILTLNHHIDYYPVRDISYLLDILLWGSNSPFSRVHQILLFWMCSGTLYFLLLRLNISKPTAALGVFIWTIHPYHNEMIIWLSARKDILALLFGLLSVLTFLKAYQDKRSNFYILYAFCFIFGILSKASVTPIPLILTLFVLTRRQKHDKKVWSALAFTLLVGGMSSLWQSWFYSHVNDMRNLMPMGLRIESSITALGKMVAGWFLPWINVLDTDSFGEWTTLNQRFFYFGFCAWVIYIFLLARSFVRKTTQETIHLVSILLLYLPISGLIFPHRTFYSTRYFEPASLGILIFYLSRLKFQRLNRLQAIASTLLILGIGTFKVVESQFWESPLAIRLKALNESPGSVSLKGYAYNEALISLNFLQEEERDDLLKLKSRLEAQLDQACVQFQSSQRKEPYLHLANCHSYFRANYYTHRGQKNWLKAGQDLDLLRASAAQLNPPEKLISRIQFENSLLKGIPKIEFLKEWLSENPYLPNVEYRILYLIAGCLLKWESQSGVARQMIQDHYLTQLALKLYIHETVSTELQPEIRRCLKI